MSSTKSTCVIAIAAAALSGCISTPTWTNLGPVDLDVSNGLTACHVDANIIDGERIEGILCSTYESGFFGGGEPEIYFSPQNRKFMREPVSTTTTGVTKDWKGKKAFLQCAPTFAVDGKTVEKRFCKVTINDQLLVSASFKYVK